MTFSPRLDILPDEQRTLWPELARVPKSLVLYGGTAVAIRLGHRTSVDFDFFSSEPLDFDELFALPWFETGDARNVDLATRELLSRTVADWRCAVSTIAKAEDRRLGPWEFSQRARRSAHRRA